MSNHKMAMPRYRYAIGQAPVRFPSPLSKEEDRNLDIQSDQNQTRSTRTSIAGNALELPSGQRRKAEDISRLHDAHRKTKSMYSEGVDFSLLAPTNNNNTTATSSRRSSILGIEASRSSESITVKPKRRTNEKTPLNNSEQDMLQRQVRPASTSISNSSRPSSLFWTDPESEAVPTGKNGPTKKTTIQRSYGAIESTAIPNNDDPYGYRALAGPTLLPSYHEQQQKQQKLKEVNSRTCGPNIEAVRNKGWKFAALAGIIIMVTGVLFVFL